MKKKLSKDRNTQKFGPMDLIQPNIIYYIKVKEYRRNSKLNIVRLSKKYNHKKVHWNFKSYDKDMGRIPDTKKLTQNTNKILKYKNI